MLASDTVVVGAKSDAKLKALIKKLNFSNKDSFQVIDASGEGWSFYPEHNVITPLSRNKRWTKKAIIELYNDSIKNEKNIIIKDKSLIIIMSTVQSKNLPSLLKKLVADQKLTQEVAEKAVIDSTERGVSITTHLAQRKLIDETDLAVYNSAQVHEKFTKEQMSNFELFLSEERLESTVFHRRFRGKMID